MENLGELLAVITTASGIFGAFLYGAGRQMWKMYTKDKREAEDAEKRIKRENALREELAEVYEKIRQQEREYLERKITDMQNQIDADRKDYDQEIARQQKSIDAMETTYQRLADSAQADKLKLEQQQEEIDSLRKEAQSMKETLKETQGELSEAKDEIAKHKIDKAVLEKQNELLEKNYRQLELQLDVMRGFVEPLQSWMRQNMAA